MSIRIERYLPAHREDWEKFIEGSRNGTLLHTRRFLSYHPVGTFEDASLLFYKDDHLAAVLPAATLEENGKKILVSHPGASYGGLVLSPAYGMEETGEIVEALMTYAREQGYAGIRFFRLPPPSVRRRYSDDQEYWLYQKHWTVFRFELATSLFLQGLTEETLLESYEGKCRNAVRQGLKGGATVSLSTDVNQFWPMLEETLKARHNTKPTHTAEAFKALQASCPGEVRLLAAEHEGKIIAGIVFMTLHHKALYTLYIAQNFEYQNLRPLPLLVHELAKLALAEKRDVLHFGISTENGGKEVNPGLFFFKESFGGVSVRRESWECTLPA